jgi:HEAT repeat protein
MLVSDSQEPIAALAATILASAIVMSDHPHSQGANSIVAVQHDLAREALRKALTDPRRSVRDPAARMLASLSDDSALTKINEAAASGLYTEVEAINYLGLSNPDVSSKYMERYLQATPTAQAAAIAYLGSNPAYQSAIRQRYLLSNDAPDVARTAAAKALSRFDPAFVTYAPGLISAKTLPPEAYAEVVTGYVTRTSGRLDKLQIERIDNDIREYKSLRPDQTLDFGKLRDIQPQMKNLSK